MKLVASMVVHNERSRYLELCLNSLLEFCDLVVILDDGSTDDLFTWVRGRERLVVIHKETSTFYEHEGRRRQRLLELTLATKPTHILAIDADEFVADGRMVRQSLQNQPNQEVWTLGMQEVWKADENALYIRRDGGWRPAETTCLFRVPEELPQSWGIADKQLACGREPVYVRQQYRNAVRTGTEILHFGWTNESERRARYARYEIADGGRFHASQHLQSILWPDNRVRLQSRPWPAGLMTYQEHLLEKVRQPR